MWTAKFIAGLTIGCFIAAALTTRDWATAADRSWHVAASILLYAWLSA